MPPASPRSSSPRRPLVAFGIAAALVVGACSGDDDESAPTTTIEAVAPTVIEPAPTTTEAPAPTTTDAAPSTTEPAPTTTVDLAATAFTYAEPGPYPVGVTTLQLDKGPSVEVWYPAAEGTEVGDISYDVRDFTPQAIKDLLTADIPASFTFQGARDAAAATDGPFPVVLFSHGFTGIRLQSTFLTAHLASWGFVVAAPDHPSRDLFNVLGGTASGDRSDAVDDLLQTLDLVIATDADSTAPFTGAVDETLVAAVGHSAGGGTILGAALDERVLGYVSMASGVPLDDGTSTTTTLEPVVLPDTPSFFLAGELDAVISPDRTRASFEAVPAPSLLWVLDGVGHNGFDDFCTFGNGTGIIGVAEASGLGPVLDAQPQLRSLGEDGCLPPAVPVADTFPVINHAVTSWLRSLFGIDAERIGLGPEVAGEYPVAVDIQVRD
jgi:predicted dienelactone hydrolase